MAPVSGSKRELIIEHIALAVPALDDFPAVPD